MKNITLAIDEDVLSEVRKYAAKHNTTVNGLVREHLTQLATQEDRQSRARAKLLDLARKSNFDPGSDWVWNREETYERGVLSRHEHPSVRRIDQSDAPDEKDSGDETDRT